MAPVAELVGRVGRLAGPHAPNEHGLTLAVKVVPTGGVNGARATAAAAACCALSADTLALVTDAGHIHVVHLARQRYTCLDTLAGAARATSAAFMTRLSRGGPAGTLVQAHPASQQRRLFVGCADGSIQCFDVATGAHLAQLPGHRAALASLSTKPDSSSMLSASADAVLLWDVATLRQRRMLGGAPYGSSQAAFSPAGGLIAAAATNGVITLWDAQSLRERGRMRAPAGAGGAAFALSGISISPDETLLLAGCRSPALLLVYDLRSQALRCGLQLPADMHGVNQVHMLPDSNTAAVLTSDGCISFVDVAAGAFSGQLQLTFPGCRAVSFATDARANSMAVVCTDGLARLYDLAVVRTRQQGASPRPQLQRLTAAELAALPAGSGAAASSAGAALRERGDPGNVPQPSRSTSTEKAAAAAKGTKGRHQQVAVAAQLCVQPLDAPAAALNRRKLQEMLAQFGEFPARYRRLIWEHLLQLPRNSQAFALLQDQELHPAFKELPQQLGLSRSSVGVRLQGCLSQLAHWCPLFGEVGFLPAFAFPFVKLFGPHSESAFEALATLLTNWGRGWFELFPNPPLPLLRRLLLLVSEHDGQLGAHLQQLGVPLLEVLWQHLASALSDLLPDASDWLVLWDHCLGAAAGPGFLHTVLCAYLITLRQHLLAASDGQQLQRLFDSRPVVDVRKVIKRAYQLHERTPQYAQLGLSSLVPLPHSAAAYPVFSEHPAGSAETQAQERVRIREAEEALIRRRQVVAELQQRSKQASYQAAALASQRQQLAALDTQRRGAMRAIEESLAAAGSRLDDRAKEEKLRQIRAAEEAYQASIAALRSEWSSELASLKADVEHRRRLAASQLKARQEEEDIKALEFQAQQRLFALQQEELAAAGSSALRDAAAAQASALAAQLQRRAAEWQSEDEARALRQQHELARKARLAAAAEQQAALQAAKGLLLAQELQTQQELSKVECQRRLRQLAEEEAELTAQQLQLQAARQAVGAAAGRQVLQEQARAHMDRSEEQHKQRMAATAAEREALTQQLSQLHTRAAELGSAARLSEAEQQMASLATSLQQADQEHAARVAAMLDKLQADQPGSTPPATAEAAATRQAGSPSAAAPGPQGQQLAASLEAVEQRLTALRQRRTALEGQYGAQVDAKLLARRQQQEAAPAAAGVGGDGALAAVRTHMPTSEASQGSGGSSPMSKATGAPSHSSGGVSAELELLLAEAEAEVQHELAVARAHLSGQSSGGSHQQQQQQHHSSLQSAAGRGRGRSGAASAATQWGGVAACSNGATPASGGRLKPVLEVPPAGGGKPAAVAAAKPTDSSSSSSSSPEHRGAAGSKGKAAAAAGAPRGNSRSSGVASVQERGASPLTHNTSPGGSTFSGVTASSAEGAAVTSQIHTAGLSLRAAAAEASAAVATASGALYQPVLLQAGAGGDAASGDTERLMTALALQGVARSASASGTTTTRSSVSKPSSLSFDVPEAAAAGAGGALDEAARNTPMLGSARSRSRTGAADAAAEALPLARLGSFETASGGSSRSGSSVEASLHSLGREEDEEQEEELGGSAVRAARAGSGRVSAELRRSSSATSQELEELLSQLSAYEAHLLDEQAQSAGHRPSAGGSELAGSLGGSSMSWSQTLAGLSPALQQQPTPLTP